MQGDLKTIVEPKKDERCSELQPKWQGERLGLYVHVPFCATACDFCAFYQVQSDRSGILNYLDGIRREAERISVTQSLDTCFFGGGTPGLLTAGDLEALCQGVTEGIGSPSMEWTVEMAPSTVKADKLKVLKDQGVTRISMGVQSFDDDLLVSLGRQHSRKQVFKAYDLVRNAGFESVNLDLIFAIPGQDERRLRRDVAEAAALAPDHLSTYCLTFEEDTALYAKLAKGIHRIDRDLEALLYEASWKAMADRGYAQYEVSNFSIPGKRCLHNINTWRMEQWIGLGPSAASQYQGERYANVPDLEKWLEGIARGAPERIERLSLTRGQLLEDALVFGLRMNEGVDLDHLQRRFGVELATHQREGLEQLEREEKIERSGEIVRVTDAGRMVVDAIGAFLMS